MGKKLVLPNHIPFLDATKLFGPVGTVRQVDFIGMRINLHASNDQRTETHVLPFTLLYHWLASDWDDVHNSYPFCVVHNPATGQVGVVQTLDWDEKPKHLWGRNTGTTAIGFAGMRDARRDSRGNLVMGSRPINDAMLAVGAVLGAEICAWKRIEPRGKVNVPKKRIVGSALVDVPGQRMYMPAVTDHSAYARQDGYPGDRWDVWTLMPVIQENLLIAYDDLS